VTGVSEDEGGTGGPRAATRRSGDRRPPRSRTIVSLSCCCWRLNPSAP